MMHVIFMKRVTRSGLS